MTVERSRQLYDVLNQYGLKTTKTVWVLKATSAAHDPDHGDTLSDPEYRDFIADIQIDSRYHTQSKPS